MKFKARWLLLILPLALLVWAFQAASWRPKLIGAQPIFVPGSLSNNPAASQLLISPDGKRLVSGWQTNVGFWIVAWATNGRKKEWKLSDEFSFPLAFSPDSRALAIGYRRGTYSRPYTAIVLLDAQSGQQRGPQMLPFHYLKSLQSVAFLSPRELVIATSQGATIADPQTGKAIRQWKFKLPPLQQTKRPLGNQSHISADGTAVIALANGTFDTAIAIYDTATGKARGQWFYKGVFRNPRLSPDGTLWAMQPENVGIFEVYDAKTGKKLNQFAGSNTDQLWTWSADSQRILSSPGAFMALSDARTGRDLGQIPGAPNTQTLALDPNGDYFYTLDDGGKIWRFRAR